MINKNNQIPISIITGAAGLLGPIHAEAILEMNGIVILTDINLPLLYKLRQKLKKKYDEKKIFIYKMDVSSEKSIRNTKKYIIQKFKRINILINNAVIDTKISKKGNFAKSNNFEKEWEEFEAELEQELESLENEFNQEMENLESELEHLLNTNDFEKELQNFEKEFEKLLNSSN